MKTGQKLLFVATLVIGVVALIAAGTTFTRFASADDVKLSKDHTEPDIKKLFHEKAQPKSTKFYEGRVRNILSRKETFGFSVRNNSVPSEIGFYVENNETNKTIIETVLFAAKENRSVRIYYDEKTSVAEAIETWGW